MRDPIYSILERINAIESELTPVGVKHGLNKQQQSVKQMPALFKPRDISPVLTAKKDPKHPADGYLVGASESQGMASEEVLSQVRRGLADYLASVEDEKRDRDLANRPEPRELGQRARDRDIIAKMQQEDFPGGPPGGPNSKKAISGTTTGQKLMKGAGRIASKAFGPAAAGLGVVDVYDRVQKNDPVGAGISAAAAVGALHPRTWLPAAGAETINVIRDLSKDEEPEEEIKPTPLPVHEDPTQTNNVVQAPSPVETYPTLPESACVKSMTMEDGSVMEIHGDDNSGYGVRCGTRGLPTRFESMSDAEMACEMYMARSRRAQQAQDLSQDYIEEA